MVIRLPLGVRVYAFRGEGYMAAGVSRGCALRARPVPQAAPAAEEPAEAPASDQVIDVEVMA